MASVCYFEPMNSYNSGKKCFGLGLVFSLLAGLGGCAALSDGAPSGTVDASNIPDAVPKAEPLSKYGNPNSYVVHGKRYYVLKNIRGYDKVGNASWYGTKFHGKYTSTREPYNMYSMTAASTTLPIPCYVRVTNLENGRAAIVKVNDRGPFRSSRLIDLSYAAAKKLGYTGKGTARVRVTTIDVSSPTSEKTYYAQNNVDTVKYPAQPTISASSKAVVTPKPLQLAKDSVYLQVGAFRTRSTAENVSKKITQLAGHFPVAVKEGQSSGAPVYKVHIGPLQNMEQSQLAQLLAKNGFNKTMIVSG
jgi:rare lipoprotein A